MGGKKYLVVLRTSDGCRAVVTDFTPQAARARACMSDGDKWLGADIEIITMVSGCTGRILSQEN